MDADASPTSELVVRGRRASWWRRIGSPEQGFRYVDAHGDPLAEGAVPRIVALKIPPAWRDVHISPNPRGRLQAIGVDGHGRAQYLYHAAFRARQDRRKFEKIEHFGEHLALLRRVTSEHLRQPGLTKQRVLATVIRVINRLYFRVGSEAGVNEYQTYGITTLRKRHLRVDGQGRLLFNFDGKHHVHQRRLLVDEDLGAILRELKTQEHPHLFAYRNGDGGMHPIEGRDVNDYIKSATGPEFTAKDFRTWHGTLLVAQELARLGPPKSKSHVKRNLAAAVRAAAHELGNTPAVCRRAYLHPTVVSLYERGITLTEGPRDAAPIAATQSGLSMAEQQLLELFHIGRVLEQQARERRSHKAVPAESGPEPVAPHVTT